MEYISFAPLIDLPLVLCFVTALVIHFNWWAQSKEPDTTVDLVSRLPIARMRVIALFVFLLFLCWILDIAVWAILVALIPIGVAVVVFSGGSSTGTELILLLPAYVIREWAFGFPQLILEPATDRSTTQAKPEPASKLIGMRGVAVSPLRPGGDVEVDGSVVSAISDDGTLIELGTDVFVSGLQGGRIRVRTLADKC